MKNKEKINKKLIDILLKKAEGFHYIEEQFEYEKSNKKNTSNYENLNFFDICDRGEHETKNHDVKMNVANEKQKGEKNEALILTKKKVTSHYIPPDMLAIKILLEIFGKEAVSDFDKMTDEELFKFKEKILGELKNENNL